MRDAADGAGMYRDSAGSRMGRLSPEWLRRLYAEHAPAGSRRRLVADGMVLGMLTLVLFMVLLLGVERLTDLGPVRRILHVFQGTFSPGTSADYSSQVVPKIAPLRPAGTSGSGTGRQPLAPQQPHNGRRISG